MADIETREGLAERRVRSCRLWELASLIATERAAGMMMAILKDFRRRLDYDSRSTSKAESLKLGRPAIRRTERMAAIAEACLQMSPAPYSSIGHLFGRGLEGSQDGPLLLACRDSLLTKPSMFRHLRL